MKFYFDGDERPLESFTPQWLKETFPDSAAITVVNDNDAPYHVIASIMIDDSLMTRLVIKP